MKADSTKLLEDTFTVTAIDPNNKTPFRNVSRVHMVSLYKVELEVDINSQIYPLTVGRNMMVKCVMS